MNYLNPNKLWKRIVNKIQRAYKSPDNHYRDLKELTILGLQLNTDKAFFHLYTEFYNDYLEIFKGKQINVLEIGILNGSSLKMWKRFFKDAHIYGCDINPNYVEKKYGNGITTFYFDQANPSEFITKIKDIKFAVIIDDGSHIVSHQQKTLGVLFKYLDIGGIYICEDLQTSLKENYFDTTISTLDMLKNFITFREIKSDEINTDDINYLNNNIEKIELFKRTNNAIKCYNCNKINNNNSNICTCGTILGPEDHSITSIIIRKNGFV